MKKMISILAVIAITGLFATTAQAKDYNRYAKCYGEMTAAHKAWGFHQKHRMMSIKIKETICTAYANGEEINYEGKI